MLRHVTSTSTPDGFNSHVRIESARDGAVDYGLLLLVQQRDQLLLGADRAPDPPVGVVRKADDCSLFHARRDRYSE